MPTLFASSEKNVQWIKVVTNDSIGKCSSELYSFNLLKLPPPPRAAILVTVCVSNILFVNYLCLLTIITHPRDPRGRPKPRVKRKQKAKPRENPKPSRRHNGKPVTPFPRGVLWVWRCKIRAGLELVLVIFILDFFGLSVERNVFCILVYLVCFSDLLLKITFCMSKSHDGFWYYGIIYICHVECFCRSTCIFDIWILWKGNSTAYKCEVPNQTLRAVDTAQAAADAEASGEAQQPPQNPRIIFLVKKLRKQSTGWWPERNLTKK